MQPRENPIPEETKKKYKNQLPRRFQALSDALKSIMKSAQESEQKSEPFNKALLNEAIMLFKKYINCAELAGFNLEPLKKEPLASLNNLINMKGEMAGSIAQYIQEQIADPIFVFHYDQVFIAQGLMGKTSFPVAHLPKELAAHITSFSQPKPIAHLVESSRPAHTLFKPNLDKLEVQELLHHIIYGDPVSAMKMLQKNPRLLLLSGDCVAPSGDRILGVTPYECALSAGDDDMALQIKACFSKIDNGAEEAKQYEKLKPFIDAMPTQKPSYDLNSLFDIIIKSSNDDVTAALNCDQAIPKSELWNALEAFRKHFAPRDIKEGMHFNYQDLQQAFNIYAAKFSELKNSGNKYDKCDLFWRQVIGYIQRGLPACDRQAFAQGINYIVEHGEKLQRKFDFRYGGGGFPITDGEVSFDGIGYKWAVVSFAWLGHTVADVGRVRLEDLCRAKTSNLQNLCPPHSRLEATGRVIS